MLFLFVIFIIITLFSPLDCLRNTRCMIEFTGVLADPQAKISSKIDLLSLLFQPFSHPCWITSTIKNSMYEYYIVFDAVVNSERKSF